MCEEEGRWGGGGEWGGKGGREGGVGGRENESENM